MRAAILLLAVALAIIACAWNANQLIDAWIALYSFEPARKVMAWSWGLIGAALGILALVMISRRAYRQIDRDFPDN
jgi:hypothetical protein